MTKQSRFPKGWDEDRVKRVLDHYEYQTEDEAVAEDEAAWEDRESVKPRLFMILAVGTSWLPKPCRILDRLFDFM